MVNSEEDWLAIADSFSQAALGAECWMSELEKFAAATGSRVGELIGISPQDKKAFHWLTGLSKEWEE